MFQDEYPIILKPQVEHEQMYRIMLQDGYHVQALTGGKPIEEIVEAARKWNEIYNGSQVTIFIVEDVTLLDRNGHKLF